MTEWTGRDDLNLQEAFELARETVKTCLGINGGAAAAILAFYGQAIGGGKLSQAAQLALRAGLTQFGVGVALASATFVLGYFVQYFWGRNYAGPTLDEAERERDKWQRVAGVLQRIAIATTLSSLGCFMSGLWAARSAIG